MVSVPSGMDLCYLLTGRCGLPSCPPCERTPSSVGFSFSSVNVTGCCPRITAPNGSGFDLAGINDCVNRDWSIPLLFDSFAFDSFLQTYLQRCTVHVPGLPFADDLVITQFLGIGCTTDPETGRRRVTVGLSVRVKYPGCIGSACCEADAEYIHTYADAEFTCAGPWTLQKTGAFGLSLSATWPDEVAVSPGGDTPPADITDCCAPSAEDCSAGPAATFNCTDGTCADPGDGSGEFADSATCAFFCGTGRLCPTPPCGDGSDGGDSGADITTSCCGSGTIGRNVSIAITGAITALWGLAWSRGFKSWVGSTVGCDTFITAALYCTTGETHNLHFKLWCGGVLVIDTDLGVAEGDSPCSPLRRTFGATLTCGSCSGLISVSISDGGGS